MCSTKALVPLAFVALAVAAPFAAPAVFGVGAGAAATGAGAAATAVGAGGAAAAAGSSLTSTLALASLGVSALGFGLTAFGQVQQGKFEAQVARNNRILSERSAQDAIQRGRISEQLQRRDVSQLIGIQRAALAGQGIEVDTGSALEITAQTAGIGEFEAQNIRANAEREAFALRTQASGFALQERLARTRSRQQAFGTVLTGAGSVLGNFSAFRTNKVI